MAAIIVKPQIINVGNLGTSPVSKYSIPIGIKNAAEITANKKAIMPKKPIGLYVLYKRIIVLITFIPSLYVLSFDSLPSGRSLYSITTFYTYIFLSTACILISVSISNPLESIGNVFTNS